MNYGEDIPRLSEYDRLSQLIDCVIDAIDFIASEPNRWDSTLGAMTRREQHTGKAWAISVVEKRLYKSRGEKFPLGAEARIKSLQRVLAELHRQRAALPADQSPIDSSTVISR